MSLIRSKPKCKDLTLFGSYLFVGLSKMAVQCWVIEARTQFGIKSLGVMDSNLAVAINIFIFYQEWRMT